MNSPNNTIMFCSGISGLSKQPDNNFQRESDSPVTPVTAKIELGDLESANALDQELRDYQITTFPVSSKLLKTVDYLEEPSFDVDIFFANPKPHNNDGVTTSVHNEACAPERIPANGTNKRPGETATKITVKDIELPIISVPADDICSTPPVKQPRLSEQPSAKRVEFGQTKVGEPEPQELLYTEQEIGEMSDADIKALGIDSDCGKQLKALRRKYRNKQAAQRARDKKKAMIQFQQQQVVALRNENQALKERLVEREQQIVKLEQLSAKKDEVITKLVKAGMPKLK